MKRTTSNFNENIKFLKMEERKTGWIVRLTVHDSGCPGSRVAATGRRIKAACWHAHGAFFENLLDINEEAIIECGHINIDRDSGNWEDMNIGSVDKPFYYSESCDCGR